MVRKIFLAALLLVAAENFLFAAEPLSMAETSNRAANFTLPDLGNKEVSLLDFYGKPVILLFWTTWCPYCRKALKQLNAMHAELSKNGVEILAINIEEPIDRVRRFVKRYPLSYRVLLDIDIRVAQAYGILGIPAYILINKAGRIVFDNYYFPGEEYKDLLSIRPNS